MAKLYTYVVICIGLIILFNLAGLQTLSGTILEQFGIESYEKISNFQGSAFYLLLEGLLVALAGLSGVGVIASFFGKNINVDAAFAGFASGIMIYFIIDLIHITSLLQTETDAWISALTVLIMLPFLIGFVMALVGWMRGMD